MGGSTKKRAEELYGRLKRQAEETGYNLNLDRDFTMDLLEGLIINQDRYGYQSCPCRIASGDKDDDLDIICPCSYRDPDLDEFGQCYCALYVSDEVLTGEKTAGSIPERRGKKVAQREPPSSAGSYAPPLPVWCCTVCGYLAGREEPPGVCPICKAKKDKFERFM